MNAQNKFSAMDMEAIEALYQKYKENPDGVDESFRYFFQGFDLATSHFPIKPMDGKATLEHSPTFLPKPIRYVPGAAIPLRWR